MIRIGQGYDVHRLVSGRDLYLCGVKVDHSLGLDGHSDADVAIHALCDALLGAIAAGDIGKLFPDNDPAYKGIDSKILLKEVVSRVKGAGYAVGNADITIIAQKPKLAPYIQEMREVMAGLLETEQDRVSVKATTTERLGFEGREEGISAMAVVLIERK
ncbi:MAG: 2-C-methyl-D-erythritol 2,4-cyclodiphosphate synthase [Bacteroides sp.]|nr:2-C-methyl-D-erythritol 2,4-cyclodiphosphate synthase [Bacteroidales bacterium]MBD5305780.1 2-C-methyl-D-erythritol 2,4-cyclodiphosphate synthase [Bacteroides sp.]